MILGVLHPTELGRILSQLGAGQPAAEFESQTLDFKRCAESDKKTLNDLTDAAVCFANSNGGTIVLGVDDKATSRSNALLGVEPSLSIETIRRGVFDRTQPPLTVFADEQFEDGVRLIVLLVPAGVSFHSDRAGRATRRLGRDCMPFSPDQQRQELAARGMIDWSAEVTSASWSDLDLAEVERMRNLLRVAGKTDLASLSDRALLESLHLTTNDGVTRAALILIGHEAALERELPSYGYAYQYRPSPGREASAHSRRRKPLLAGVEEAIQLVASRTQLRPLNVAGGVQIQLVDYPDQAVREIIVNAFVHRSFDDAGNVDIEHSPGSLTVSSPGGFVPGVTVDNVLTHPSTPRHRLLFEVVSICQLAERTGQGIDRAYREMLRMGKQPPRFADTDHLVRATLDGGIGNGAFVRFIDDLPADLGRDVDVLLALSYLRTAKSINARRLADLIQRSADDAEMVLSRLAEPDVALVEATRGSASKRLPTYVLRPVPLSALGRALTYSRHTVGQIDEKVMEHVREYGFVTNKTLQRLFDVHVYAARDLLLDLRRRGILEKVGDARGGRGVRYAPGPAFIDPPK